MGVVVVVWSVCCCCDCECGEFNVYDEWVRGDIDEIL